MSATPMPTLVAEMRAKLATRIMSSCTRCGVPLEVPALTAGCCACDPCIEAVAKERRTQEVEARWARADLCPPGSVFRDTDPKHPNFPRRQYDATKTWSGDETLIFLGPSGTGKTRLAMHLLKRCLFLDGKSAAALWPEDLKHCAKALDRRDELDRYTHVAVLLIDDPFLTGAVDERVGDFLKDLIDRRARRGRHQIITSQFGGDDYRAAFDAYLARTHQSATASDWARFDALFRRVREGARTIAFPSP